MPVESITVVKGDTDQGREWHRTFGLEVDAVSAARRALCSVDTLVRECTAFADSSYSSPNPELTSTPVASKARRTPFVGVTRRARLSDDDLGRLVQSTVPCRAQPSRSAAQTSHRVEVDTQTGGTRSALEIASYNAGTNQHP